MKCSRIVDGKICGVELEPNGKFCTECGEDVREAPCPQCQEQLRETQKFCKNCRFKVTDNLFQTKKSTDQKDTTNDDDETKSKSKESEKDRTAKAKNVSESSIDCEKKESVLDANKEVKDSNENYHENCNLSTPSSSEVSASPNDEVESKSQENDTNEALNRENNHENCSLNKPPSSESTAAPNDEVKSKSQENEVNEALNRESQEDTTVNSIPDEVNNENQENREDNGGERSPTKVDNDGHSPTKVDNDGRSPTKVNNGATASDGSKTSEGDQEDTKINSTPDGVTNENEENRGNNDGGRSPTKVDNSAKARDESEASEGDQEDTKINSTPDGVNNENEENRGNNDGGRSPTKVDNGAKARDGSEASEGDQEDTKINSTPDGVNNENEENRGNNDDGRSPTKVDNGAKARDGSEASEGDQEDTKINSTPDGVNNENEENRGNNDGGRSPTKVDNGAKARDGSEASEGDQEDTKINSTPDGVNNENEENRGNNDGGRSPTKVDNGAKARDGSEASEGDQEDTKINSTPDGVNNDNVENRGNNDDGRSPTKVDNGAKARDGSEASEDDQTDSEDSSDSSSDSDNNIDDKNANSHPNGNEQNKEKSDSKVNDEDVRIHKYQGENEADSMDDKNEAETKDVNSDGTTYDENVNKENEEKPNSHDNKRGNNRLLQHLEEDKHDNESESINDGENGNSSKAGPNANECSSVDNEHDHEKMGDLEPLAKSMTENGSSEKSSGKSTKKKEQQKKQKNVKASVKNAFKHMTKSSEGKKETNSGKGQKEQNKSNSKNSSKKKDETKQRNTKIVQTDALNKSSTGCHKETKTDRISKENIQPQDPHIEEGKNGKQDKTSRPTNEQADGNLDMNEPTCHIYFHPILSPSILRNPGNDRVFVKVELGKKSHKRLELTFKRKVRGNEGCMEYEGLISIQQSNNLSLCYNYCVETKDNKVIEEYVYDNGNKSPIPREFISTKRKDVYHLYDGVIRSNLKDEKEKGSSMLSSFTNTISTFVTGGAALKTLQEDAKLMIRHFLSHFLDSVVNGVELISNVGCLCSGVNRFYFLREKLWSDRKAMDVQISKEMAPIVHETVSELVKRNGKTKEDRLVILEKAMSIVLLNETYAGIHIDDQTLENICKVLLPDPIDRDGCVYLLSSMKTKYAADIRIPIDGLKNIMTVSLKQGTFSWLYCLPLLHFLEERYEPYQSIPDDANHRDKVPVWWGIESVNTLLENFKRKRHERSPRNTLQFLAPFFELDFLLERSFVAALTFQDLVQLDNAVSDLSVDVLLAAVYYYIEQGYLLKSENLKNFKLLLDKIADAAYRLRNKNNSPVDAKRTFVISKEIAFHKQFEKMFLTPMATPIRTKNSALFVLIVDWLASTLIHSTNAVDKQILKASQVDFINICDSLVHELCLAEKDKTFDRLFWSRAEWIELWNDAFKAKIPEGKVKAEYKKKLETELSKRLQQWKSKTQQETLIDLYCSYNENYEPALQVVIGRYAFQAVSVCVNADSNIEVIQGKKLMHYGKLLSHLFERNLDQRQVQNQQWCLVHALTWSPFMVFLKMYGSVQNRQYLAKQCVDFICNVIGILNDICKDVLAGDISIDVLSIVLSQKDRFLSFICEIKAFHVSDIELAIALREREYSTFKETLILMKNFVFCCKQIHGIPDDTEETAAALSDNRKLKCSQLCKVAKMIQCTPHDPSNKASNESDRRQKYVKEDEIRLEDYKPTLLAFKFSHDELMIVKDIVKKFASKSFRNIWDKVGRVLQGQKHRRLKEKDIIEDVYKQVIFQWDNLCCKLRSGEMNFTEFKDCYISEGLNTPDKLVQELLPFDTAENTRPWVTERLKQYEYFNDTISCQKGAKTLMDLVEKFQLNIDSARITDINRLAKGEDCEMKRCDSEFQSASTILKGVDEKKINCIEILVKCFPLIEWLQKTMATGLKELKVFVDLASMTTGESDIEKDRVQFLHAATTGYAPLIFQLKDCKTDTDLMKRCHTVWKELESDKNLPNKLKDTYKELEWLKSVEQSHGSVEKNSLEQTESINTDGVYDVGNIKSATDLESNQLQNTIALNIFHKSNGREIDKDEEDFSKPKIQKMHYDQLVDLQSRLMLVAGKAEQGKDAVDRFMVIFDAIVRLANIYRKLVKDGCVLFNFWHATFFCNPGTPACIQVHFGHGEYMHTLKGRKDSKLSEVSSMIPKLAKILEKCHLEWIEFIDKKRKSCPCLNLYTIDQIVILQQELVKIGTNEEPSLHIYPLLSAIKSNCCKEDVISAMKEAQVDVTSKETSQEQEMNEEEPDEITDENIRKIMDQGFSFLQAKEAILLNDNYGDAIDWCYDHENDFTGDDNQADEVFSGWKRETHSFAALTSRLIDNLDVEKESAFGKLKRSIRKLWKEFLSSVSSSVADYLSVEHLGLILKRLSEIDEVKIQRPVPKYLKMGEPNLVVCQEDDIYNTVLAIYSFQTNAPLPQADEVLLCTPETTTDMVNTFWRRAFDPDSEKIYCLVNVGCLDYEVCDKAEKMLQLNLKDAGLKESQYRLIVLCTPEDEQRSMLVRALVNYLRNHIPVDRNAIREYILSKLRVDQTKLHVDPASSVDTDRSSVRYVKSFRAGVGKTLFKTRMTEQLQKLSSHNRDLQCSYSIPIHGRALKQDNVMATLLETTLLPHSNVPRIFHFDISYEVQEGVDDFLFQLLILGCITHSSGLVWRKSEIDYYIIESMPQLSKEKDSQHQTYRSIHNCLDILPPITCRSPDESLDVLKKARKKEPFPPDYSTTDRLFDEIAFREETFQRPYQYLRRYDKGKPFIDVNPTKWEGEQEECLSIFLRHCGIQSPSWSELAHFIRFLDKQLRDFERSCFCQDYFKAELPGFAQFVLKFLIQMSRDFATRSLKISEETPLEMHERRMEDETLTSDESVLDLYKMRRTWETSPHPYLFFHPDGNSMTFLGFNIDRRTGNLIDHQTEKVLERGIMQRNLFDSLQNNGVNLLENFDTLSRKQKIDKLWKVMGVEVDDKHWYDPDPTYELTTDNVKKMLAMYMRFRCAIPVIIMGETGCGKTRLIRFLSALQRPPTDLLDKLDRNSPDNQGVESTTIKERLQNMILMKVHGGTKVKDIVRKVEKAEKIAQENEAIFQQYKELKKYEHMYTILFFDEANTTEAIGVIKEIMCDHSLNGRRIKIHEKLKIVAACNPYRKHSEDLIQRLEQAGLGYHVAAQDSKDKLGRVPMRRLVYRVQPLPQSMLPLVWDFGQLDINAEEQYIRQMVQRKLDSGSIPDSPNLKQVVSKILTVSQEFMRQQKDECSFVSLRDVERVLDVMCWFYSKNEEHELLFKKVIDENGQEQKDFKDLDSVSRSLVLSLGVCYHSCLRNREYYRQKIARYFTKPLGLPEGGEQFLYEVNRCQAAILSFIKLPPNIARNQALKENVFMMVICIELRIPMFLVGKPGSSKSLAKSTVADTLQGSNSAERLFKNYKQVQMVSFQCSPLSTPDGIVGTFAQCAAYQKGKDLNRFVSVVVLDEIGLAEDSPRMPLKTLHPLLEDGCPDDEDPEDYKKVAFIGISNWALDPAKMNRGIFVQRDVPDKEELINSAIGICSSDKTVKALLEPMIDALATSYLRLFDESTKEMREFFGLRDFYSLIKMLFGFILKTKVKPTWMQLKHSVLRNFGGLEVVNPVEVFQQELSSQVDENEERKPFDPECTPEGMIQACLKGDEDPLNGSRYLLLLIENLGVINILQQELFTNQKAVIIFGSSFPSDQEYTQVCRNINRIKVCMETGNTVILLNLENLYESLYDALNQYYVEFGGERYVDLGLGSHRVKCRVHRKFRLIVVAEKKIVYSNFPIPLINRLEKHFLTMNTLLTPKQNELKLLNEWLNSFSTPKEFSQSRKKTKPLGESFIGYHADVCPAVIQKIYKSKSKDYKDDEKQIVNEAKHLLLWCATPAAVLQNGEKNDIITYFRKQQHDCLSDFVCKTFSDNDDNVAFIQTTTSSRILSVHEIDKFREALPSFVKNIHLLTLQSFHTEQQFSREVKSCFPKNRKKSKDTLLIVQSECGDQNVDLIACARYSIQRDVQEVVQDGITSKIRIILLVQLSGITGGFFSGYQCAVWQSVHIDDLRTMELVPPIMEMYGKSVYQIICSKQASCDDFLKSDVAAGEESEIQEIPRRSIYQPETNVENCAICKDISKSTEIIYSRKQTVFLEKVRIPNDGFEDRREDVIQDVVSKEQKVHQFDINKLILRCIQRSLAAVKDPDDSLSRSTDRLNSVLDILEHPTYSSQLLTGVRKHVIKLLTEKNRSRSFGTQDGWLAYEAAKDENIHKAGTFRNSILTCFESRILPILSAVFAFLDTNRNISLSIKDNVSDWKFALWYKILNNPEVTQLTYNDIISPTKAEELKEYTVKFTSLGGKSFTAKMPFSWLVNESIQKVLKNIKGSADHKEDVNDTVMEATNILKNLPLGELLLDLGETFQYDVLECYIEDFISMVYSSTSDEELKLVTDTLKSGYKVLTKNAETENNILFLLAAVHVFFYETSHRFDNFSHVVHVWPGSCEKILQMDERQKIKKMDENQKDVQKPDVKSKQKASKKEESLNINFSSDDMCVDILALQLMLKEIQPARKSISDEEWRKDWQERVSKFRPVVERIFEDISNMQLMKPFHFNESKYGNVINKSRCEWTRTLVVKFYIENVCTEGIGAKVMASMKLWSKLDENTDMKMLNSVQSVEDHLVKQNIEVLGECFGLAKCSSCEEEIQSMPVKLPCKHVVCKRCYMTQIDEKKFCLKCKKSVPEDYDPDEVNDREEVLKYENFRERCNCFFMEVISQLCFAEDTMPSPEVVDKLLSYIVGIDSSSRKQTVVSRQLTVFKDAIDPNPVVRSFLLQKMMQTRGSNIKHLLLKYFSGMVELCGQTEMTDLYLLVLQCMEDATYQLFQKNRNSQEEIVLANQKLGYCVGLFNEDLPVLDEIEAVAGLKVSLSLVAKYVHLQYTSSKPLDVYVKHLLEAAGRLCENPKSDWPRYYFVKDICRRFGVEFYQKLLQRKEEHLKWLCIPNFEVKVGLDRYLISGGKYSEIMGVISELIKQQSENTQFTIAKKGESTQVWRTEIALLLALHRKVAMNDLYHEGMEKMSKEDKKCLQKTVVSPFQQEQMVELLSAVIENRVWKADCNENISQGMDYGQQNVSCLLFHFYVVILKLPGLTTLFAPLKNLACFPAKMKDSFFPTMPDDDIAMLTTLMRDYATEHKIGRWYSDSTIELPTFYKCPNGHPYIVGDCGKAYTTMKCDCGETIGGSGHILLNSNSEASVNKTVTKGHILGKAGSKITELPSIPRNSVNRPSLAMLRLLTHMSMFVGANVDRKAVHESINLLQEGTLNDDEVPDFLIEHIKLDLESLRQILGKGKDDIYSIVHYFLTDVVSKHTDAFIAEHHLEEMCELKSEKNRSNWEEMFDKEFIQPLFKNLDNVIEECNTLVTSEEHIGKDQLVEMVYEKNVQERSTKHISKHRDHPSVWRFRSRISVEHLLQMLNASDNHFPLLHAFLKEEHHLRILRLVPDVVCLHKLLMKMYGRKLDRSESTLLTIEDVHQQIIKQGGNADEFRHLVDKFIETWDTVRLGLESYTCNTYYGRLAVPKSICRKPIDYKFPISFLLPTMKDNGCSYIMLRFLLEKHNNFMDQYCYHKKMLYSKLPRIHVKNLSMAHLISYHPDKDLLPMLLANCSYSFEVGHGTNIEYNFVNLERQIADRYLFSKSVVNGLDEIETFTYRAEYTNGIVLKTLATKIQQEHIPLNLKIHIISELQRMTFQDLCESLDKLDTAISFLNSVGLERPDMLLSTFMTKTLKIENAFPSTKALQTVKCTNTMSWWMVLSLERAKSLMKYNQEPFNAVDKSFQAELTDLQTDLLDGEFKALPAETMRDLLQLVFEFIILNIDVPEDKEDQSYVDKTNQSLQSHLVEFYESLPYKDNPTIDQDLKTAVEKLPQNETGNGSKITVAQTTSFWKYMYSLLYPIKP